MKFCILLAIVLSTTDAIRLTRHQMSGKASADPAEDVAGTALMEYVPLKGDVVVLLENERTRKLYPNYIGRQGTIMRYSPAQSGGLVEVNIDGTRGQIILMKSEFEKIPDTSRILDEWDVQLLTTKRDPDLQLLTFNIKEESMEKIGIRYHTKSGVVTGVSGPAADQKVQVGWKMLQINGEAFSPEIFNAAVESGKTFTIQFDRVLWVEFYWTKKAKEHGGPEEIGSPVPAIDRAGFEMTNNAKYWASKFKLKPENDWEAFIQLGVVARRQVFQTGDSVQHISNEMKGVVADPTPYGIYGEVLVDFEHVRGYVLVSQDKLQFETRKWKVVAPTPLFYSDAPNCDAVVTGEELHPTSIVRGVEIKNEEGESWLDLDGVSHDNGVSWLDLREGHFLPKFGATQKNFEEVGEIKVGDSYEVQKPNGTWVECTIFQILDQQIKVKRSGGEIQPIKRADLESKLRNLS